MRHRAKLVGLRSCLKNQIHAVLAGADVQVPMSDLFGLGGRELLPPHGFGWSPAPGSIHCCG